MRRWYPSHHRELLHCGATLEHVVGLLRIPSPPNVRGEGLVLSGSKIHFSEFNKRKPRSLNDLGLLEDGVKILF